MWFLIPFFATALALIGNYLLVKKQVLGWWAHLATTIMWVTYGIYIADPALWIACAMYLPFDIWGILKWNKKEQKKNKTISQES